MDWMADMIGLAKDRYEREPTLYCACSYCCLRVRVVLWLSNVYTAAGEKERE